MTHTEARDERELSAWLEDEHTDGARRRSRIGVVLALAAIPWVVVGAVVLRPAEGSGAAARVAPAPVSDAPVAAPPSPPSAIVTPSAPGRTGAADVDATVLSSGARSGTTLLEAAAVALVTARAFAAGDGAPLGVEGLPPAPLDGYVEHLVVEAVDHPGPDAAVVTVLAVVLRATEGRYLTAELRRLAVPLRVDADGAQPAGRPWWLPAPELAAVDPPLEDVADEDLLVAAAEAVSLAGYRDVTTISLSTTAGWPLVADLTATAPGETTPAEHRLWLRHHLGGLVVAGERPRPTAAGALPAGPPATTTLPPTEETAP